MPDHAIASTRAHELRTRAAARVVAPVGAPGRVAGPTDALAVLHALASSPATAGDALALLHELQVHQVELDLQAQELSESRAELEAALRRQAELYEHQPVACFTIDRRLVIQELNEPGARMLGLKRDAACGLGLDTFFSARGTDRLQTLVSMATPGGPAPSATLEWRSKAGHAAAVHAHLGSDPSGDGFLVVLTDAAAPVNAPSARAAGGRTRS